MSDAWRYSRAVTALPHWKPSNRLAGLLAALLLVAAPEFAAAERLRLASGKSISGEVTRLDGDLVEVQLSGGQTRKVALAELAPRDRYRLLRRLRPAKTGADHFELAEICREAAMLEKAAAHYREALRLDSGLAERVEGRIHELQETAAGEAYRMALVEVKARRLERAQELLRALLERYPRTVAGRWARELLMVVDRGLVAQAEAARQEKELERAKKLLGKELRRERQRDRLRIAIDHAEQLGLEHYRLALMAEGESKQATAMGHFTTAADSFDQAYQASKLLREMIKSNRAVVSVLRERQQRLVHSWVVNCLAAAHLRARQGNWRDAHRWLERALTLEPLNEEAKKLHHEIARHRIRRKVSKITNAKPIVSGR